jgi:hypothetical protein
LRDAEQAAAQRDGQNLACRAVKSATDFSQTGGVFSHLETPDENFANSGIAPE